MAPNPNHSDIPIHQLVQDYYSNKPNFGQHIGKSAQPSKENEPSKTSPDELQQGIESLQVDKDKNPTLEEQKEYFFKYGGIAKARKANMPVHPAEENVSGSITDQVAKDSSDSTASSAPQHQVQTGATSGGSIGAQAHKANLGPVVAENIGEPASKEELKKRAEELNK
ncbi:hypothetical protein BS50DRAFT_623429 [Corynespora cassiicola Philippines]|uniref:Uncharacterized protein n=1 Tax=Corynespora cassiicola Philippines TaxID=1448308 RepID=A0A2T2NF98_CORCC|nr:hypothetical protein BS50DRAFT_623429 [Corynespora cassiicola Philippines]